ncbi:MAG: 30S ribosomal protein S16 [Candidatus Peribacteraceae bacterium]|nr:30S ribosomal protein S16 [Candidatus Peribacteraceae bacterium]
MLTIRLSRIGHENLQKFRLVVQEKTASPKSGKVVAIVGNYDPSDPENKLIFDAEKIEAFLKNGAEPSDTVARLLVKNGFKKELVEKFVIKYAKQKSKSEKKEEGGGAKKAEVAEKPAAESAPTEDASKEEAKAEEKPAEETKEKSEASPEEKPAEEPKKEERPAEEDKPDAAKEKSDS